ncbi:MAG: hypothetical protein LQ349_009849 [Xanthoria aureola]|nr:MAG: hypothetical protein LQ349_009849 [Xanthoria aureola]
MVSPSMRVDDFSINVSFATALSELRLRPPQHRTRFAAGTPSTRQFNPLPTPSGGVSVFNVFDGTSIHTSTATLPLTTKPATTFTTSGSTVTMPATTYPAVNDRIPIYPAQGCWDDPKCWFSKTHAIATAVPTGGVPPEKAHGHHSARNRFHKLAPYFALAIMVALCIGMVLWLALGWRAKKLKKRREEAKERQERRMGGGTVGGGAGEGEGASGEAPIPLQSMSGEEDGRIPRPERVYSNGFFGGRSEVGSPSRRYGEYGREP